MTKHIREHKKKLDKLLSENSPDTDWEAVSAELLVKIGFYQHERLVHLIVTMSVAIMLVMSVLATVLISDVNEILLVLDGLFFVLTAPYIVYYFMLENAVQDIYKYYDKILSISGK